MYFRQISSRIDEKLSPKKAIIVSGPRQVGKTTLIKSILKDKTHLSLNGDDMSARAVLATAEKEKLKTVIGKHKYVFIDEAQQIDNIGISAKIILDELQDVNLILSGSSSFDLNNAIQEPLTGRKWEYELYPISWKEYEEHHGYFEAHQKLEENLIFGLYPDVLNNSGDEVEVLSNLVSSYLYKDILALANLRKPEVLDKLVLALALQIGNEVDYRELSTLIGIDKNTVIKYIDVLEKAFVIFKLPAYSKNIRNEIKKSKKIYFFDNGLRNMIIGDFRPITMRQDKGALWENFLIAERVKQRSYQKRIARHYFWRTTQQQEIDFIEEKSTTLSAFEFKWNNKKARIPRTFSRAYNPEEFVVDKDSFRDFVM